MRSSASCAARGDGVRVGDLDRQRRADALRAVRRSGRWRSPAAPFASCRARRGLGGAAVLRAQSGRLVAERLSTPVAVGAREPDRARARRARARPLPATRRARPGAPGSAEPRPAHAARPAARRAISRTRARSVGGSDRAERAQLVDQVRRRGHGSHPLFELCERAVQPCRDGGGRDPEQRAVSSPSSSSTTRSAITSRSPAVRARSPSSSSGENPSPNACSRPAAARAPPPAPRACGGARLGAEPVERGRARDREQPGPRRSAARVELPPAPERGLERLARQVLGEGPVLRQVEQVAVDVVEQLLGDGGERRRRGLRPGGARRCSPRACLLYAAGSRRASPRLGLLEQPLPAPEELGQLVAGCAMGGEDVHVRPVVGELPLELGDPRLRRRDLRLEPLELRRRPALRRAGRACSRLRLRTRASGSAAGAALRSRSRSAQPPSYERSERSSIATIRSGTASRSARSWETMSTVPGNASSAASSASRLSRSRWFVGSSRTRKFAPEATSSASASRRRSPPESAVTERSCVSQPEKRKRPSSICACGLGSPVAAAVQSSTEPCVGQLLRVLREVPGHDAVTEARRPAVERVTVRGSPRAAWSSRSRSGRRARPSRRARRRTSRPRAAPCRPPRGRRPRPRGRHARSAAGAGSRTRASGASA